MAALQFLPAARLEYLEALDWYRTRSKTAALAFANAIETGLRQISEAPERWSRYDDEHRIVLIERFPYTLIYRIEDAGVLVVAVPHVRRKPGYWKHRGQDESHGD